jgi:hypothetical protein
MWPRPLLRLLAVTSFCLLFSARAALAQSEGQLAQTVKTILSKSFTPDWQGIEKLPGIKWAPLPPAMLTNCLPDGGCFTRQGTLVLGDKKFLVLASGARSMVSTIYFRNATSPIGEAPVVASLKQNGFSTDLVRCPVPNTIGGTNWYRLKAPSSEPGYLAVQSSCNGRPCEGFIISFGADLPPLQPNQLRLYSESCAATGPGATAARKPVSTLMPPEQLAQTFIALLPPVSGPAYQDWKVLPTLLPATEWAPGGPKQFPPNPMQYSGQLKLSGREFSVLASGQPAKVQSISFDEMRLHPRGEDLLSYLRAQGFDVKLTRCGPVYTQSINNWYAVTSPKTHPAMLRQSLRLDGNQIQDTYELRFDNTLPARDPRDRDPGVGGCK